MDRSEGRFLGIGPELTKNEECCSAAEGGPKPQTGGAFEMYAAGKRNEPSIQFLSGPGHERWYVVHTRSHAEDRAIVNLARQSFETFCPRLRKTVHHARKRTHVLTPLFPGYVFIRLNVQRDGWRSVNGTRGVVRILTQGDVPLAVPTGIVETLRAKIDLQGAVDWMLSFSVGDTVRICDGPFAGFVGRLEYLDGAGRVRVLLDLMGRAVSVGARSQMVAPVA